MKNKKNYKAGRLQYKIVPFLGFERVKTER